ncbi:MAG: hypothetical protein KA314_07060 [Chloroflexi bacterium]|nr:hypothetical protein [Chloroflexota bacterium]MBP8055584.1 hypothetical protein [Chloroflexota bacterium]
MITIRPVETLDEVHKLADLQRAAWAALPDRELIPSHLLRGASVNGDLLLGAYAGEQIVGFVFGILGWAYWLTEPVLQLYSATMGVMPAYQSYGVGFQLKLAQRAWALERGVGLVTWTYDPLLARNAWLNVGKLGVVCGRYLADFYGEAEDRFHVEWWLQSERVKARLEGGTRPRTSTATPFPHTPLVSVPPDYLTLCHTDPPLAHQWRYQSRQTFTDLFAQGYQITDFVRTAESGYYILTPRQK